MKRLLRLFIILGLLIGIAAAALAYLNQAVLPVKARSWAQTQATQALGRTVSIERVRLHPWHGFLLEEVTIAEESSFGKTPFLKVDRISGGILFLPLFKEKKLIIPTLHLVGLEGQFLQNTQGDWNFKTLGSKEARQKSKSKNGFQFLVPRVLLQDSNLTVRFLQENQPTNLKLSKLNASLQISLPAQAGWKLSTQLNDLDAARLNLQGSYRLKEKTVNLKGRCELPTPLALSYLPKRLQTKFQSSSGNLTWNFQAQGNPSDSVLLESELKTENLKLSMEHPVRSGWSGSPPQALEIDGDFTLKTKTPLPWPQGPQTWEKFSATTTLRGIRLSPLPRIQAVEALTGVIQKTDSGIEASSLTAQLPSGTSVQLTAQWGYAGQQPIAWSVTTQPTLPELMATLPQSKGIASWQPQGTVDLKVQGTGTLKPFSVHPQGKAKFAGLGLQPPGSPPIQNGSGTLQFEPDQITLSDFRALWKGQPFKMEATATQLDEPQVNLKLDWGQIATQTQFTLRENRIEIQEMTGQLPEGKFRVLGEIRQNRQDNASVPMGNLYGELTGPVEQFLALLPNPPEPLKKLAPQGDIAARWFLQGDLRQPSQLDYDVKLNASQFQLQGLNFTNVDLQLQQEAGRLTLPALQGGWGGGQFLLTGVLDQKDPKQSWIGTLQLREMELANLARQFNWKTEGLGGNLSLRWEGSGEGTNASAITGNGLLQITGGEILELPFLGRFASLLKLEKLKKLVFTDAQGNFSLQGGQIETRSFELKSPQASLLISGSGGFLQGVASPINWTIVPEFNPDVFSDDTQGRLGEIISRGTQILAGEIRVTGTWKEPKKSYQTKALPDVINEQIRSLPDLLEDIF